MISGIFSRLAILTFGTLYPAYASFKAVRAKNVQEYVKWMMYWIVFAIFTTLETFTDLFLPWFPFYHELKVVVVLWLLSPVTNGSSILYRKCVHPLLKRKEPEIDECIVRVREQGYATLIQLANRAYHYVSDVVMHALQRNFHLVGQPHTLMSGSKSMGRLAELRAIDNASAMPRSRSLHSAIIEERSADEFELRELHYELQSLAEPSGSRTRASTKKVPEGSAKGIVKGKKPATGGRGRGRKPKEPTPDSGEE